MSDPVIPYLDFMRLQLESTLVPKDDSVKKTAIYSHRMLTLLALRMQELPKIQRDVLRKYDALLDEMTSELGNIPGTMILIPQLTCHVRTTPDYRKAEPFLQNAVRLFAAHPNEARRVLMRKIAAITLAVEDAFHEAAAANAIKPVLEEKPREPLDAKQKAALRDYLRRKFPSESGIDIGNVKLVVGGGSKQTLIVDLRGAVKLPSAIVLRLDYAGGVVVSSVVNEFKLIQALFDAGLKVPQPLAIEPDKSILGASFIVVSRVEGHNIGDWEEVTEPSREFAVELAHTMAGLHNVSPNVAGNALPGAEVTTRERVARELAVFEESWRTHGEASVAMEQAYAWLKSHMEFADGQRSIVHGDIGCHNMLGHEGRMTALLDWETAVVGNPAQDLAYVRHTVEQMMPWEEFLSEYAKAGGKVPDAGVLDFYRLWRGVFTMHYEYMARAFFLYGGSQSLIIAYSSQCVFQYCYRELHKTVKLVYDNYE